MCAAKFSTNLSSDLKSSKPLNLLTGGDEMKNRGKFGEILNIR